MILLDYSWLNTLRCINNNRFLWYITANSRYFDKFICLYITPITLCCTNTKNLWCNSIRYKTKNLGVRKWIFLMPQITVTISDVFAFLDKFIIFKWTILDIKVSVLSPKQALIKIHFIFRYSMNKFVLFHFWPFSCDRCLNDILHICKCG